MTLKFSVARVVLYVPIAGFSPTTVQPISFVFALICSYFAACAWSKIVSLKAQQVPDLVFVSVWHTGYKYASRSLCNVDDDHSSLCLCSVTQRSLQAVLTDDS
jgi:hypothetical protein